MNCGGEDGDVDVDDDDYRVDYCCYGDLEMN